MAETPNRSIRIPDPLWVWLQATANTEGRSISNLIIFLLEQARRSRESK